MKTPPRKFRRLAFPHFEDVARRREHGAGTVEFAIVLIAVLVVGAGLLAFGGTMGKQVEKTGEAVASWTGGAIGAGDSAIESPQEKADRELAEKEPKDWTLDDQKRVAEDISTNGSGSKFYEKAKSAMDAGTNWSVTLTNGKEMRYRIIGIAHDDLAGGGKAGLTFMAKNSIDLCRVNSKDSNVGGWEKSDLRKRMSSGDIWNLMPSDLQTKMQIVNKLSNNVGGGSANKDAQVSATQDALFLVSFAELAPSTYVDSDLGWQFRGTSWLSKEGYQYEVFAGKVVNCSSGNPALYQMFPENRGFSQRTCTPVDSKGFGYVLGNNGSYDNRGAITCAYAGERSILPAWCF